jgi:hypothetical protein
VRRLVFRHHRYLSLGQVVHDRSYLGGGTITFALF